jgi:hypothetical protein
MTRLRRPMVLFVPPSHTLSGCKLPRTSKGGASVPDRHGRTDLVAERGENVVKNAFAEILQWVARKDYPDDGIDLNVEIPADGTYPAERVLVQVKTAGRIKPRKDGSWPASVRGSALRKYKRSRHAVFLFVVDLASDEIRWIDLLDILRQTPDQRTFVLPAAQKFDEPAAGTFRQAVRSAIDTQNDRHHPPGQALVYRAQQVEAQDPRFAVRGEIVGGLERYTLTPKPGFAPKVKIVPRTRADSRRLDDAMEFGSTAEIKLKNFELDGGRAFTEGETREALLKIEPKSQRFRVAITSHLGVDGSEKSHLELNARVARGLRGFEIRSDDPACPFQFVLKLDSAQSSCAFAIEIHYEQWNGQPFTKLPLLDQILALARCFAEPSRLLFELIDYGERRELLSTHTASSKSKQFKQTVSYLKFLRKVSRVCRQIGSRATYSNTEIHDIAQGTSLELAYSLVEGAAIPVEPRTYVVSPQPKGRPVLLASEQPRPLIVRMPMHLHFGKTQIGEMPVRVAINDYTVVENSDGSISLRPKSASELTLDTEPLVGTLPD